MRVEMERMAAARAELKKAVVEAFLSDMKKLSKLSTVDVCVAFVTVCLCVMSSCVIVLMLKIILR